MPPPGGQRRDGARRVAGRFDGVMLESSAHAVATPVREHWASLKQSRAAEVAVSLRKSIVGPLMAPPSEVTLARNLGSTHHKFEEIFNGSFASSNFDGFSALKRSFCMAAICEMNKILVGRDNHISVQ